VAQVAVVTVGALTSWVALAPVVVAVTTVVFAGPDAAHMANAAAWSPASLWPEKPATVVHDAGFAVPVVTAMPRAFDGIVPSRTSPLVGIVAGFEALRR
jgi:hypothetical protein